jgi:hypothetical protein
MDIFMHISGSKKYLSFKEFIECLPLLGYEMAKGKVKENKHRLKEIVSVLKYPTSHLSAPIAKILNRNGPFGNLP